MAAAHFTPLPGSDRSLGFASITLALREHDSDATALPYCLRLLVENLVRHAEANGADGDAALRSIARWPGETGVAVPLHVARVILPDSSGLPVLLDLASIRDAVSRAGGDPSSVRPRVPVDIVIDHSLQVDHAGRADAVTLNLAREFERNDERYRFVKWAQSALGNLRVFPPGAGIIHQVNLEHVARVVMQQDTPEGTLLFPDFVIGGDSHTPMINGLGVLGWGVGGIDAEAMLLGYPTTIALPEVVGVRLQGRLPDGSTTTDLVLLVTERLRAAGVTGCFVEFHGDAVDGLTVPDRATLANMAPEYGATVGYFPVDANTLAYLRATGRDAEHVALVERYCRANVLFRDAAAAAPRYSREIVIELADAVPTLAGPRRPQDRLPLANVASDFRARLAQGAGDGGFGVPQPRITREEGLRDGSIVIASITSCTNTSNPSVMLAAGLVARNAVARGITPPSWVKTSLAPGSQAVTRYLAAAGLLTPLEALGFHVVGYGCTTCAGKSGPLDASVAQAVERDGLVVATVLSGNRNFEGRIHRLARANYIGSPPLVVAYALAGRIDIDLTREPVAYDAAGAPVMLSDLWPSAAQIAELLPVASDPAHYRAVYEDAQRGPDLWRAMEAPASDRFEWDRASTYLVEPPFVDGVIDGEPLPERFEGARVLAAFGDSLTTDHISPSGEIPAESAAGRYLIGLGIAPSSFNSYVGRRCNHEVMLRGTFANVRVRNQLVPGVEGGFTRKWPGDAVLPIHEAAAAYRAERTPLLVLGGRDYGSGSSRDWAAKGTALLGVRAVLAESFERIHRSNLISMGVVPLRFEAGEGWRSLGLEGDETFTLVDVRKAVLENARVCVEARGAQRVKRFELTPDVHTEFERRLLAEGGMLPSMMKNLLAGAGEMAT